MALAKPADLPLWAINPDPQAIATPAPSKIDSGFVNQERPPRQDFNYLFNLLGEWRRWEEAVNIKAPTFVYTENTTVGAGVVAGRNGSFVVARNLLRMYMIVNYTEATALERFEVDLPVVQGPQAIDVQLNTRFVSGGAVTRTMVDWNELTIGPFLNRPPTLIWGFGGGNDNKVEVILDTPVTFPPATGQFNVWIDLTLPITDFWDDPNF